MKKVILIDDETLARGLVKEYLQNHTDLEVVAECGNGFEGIKAVSQHKPDLLFLDIQMPKINGFEMLELLSEIPSVIFTTAFDEFALRAFEANAIDYLLKPFSQDRFDLAIHKWKSQKQAEPMVSKLQDFNPKYAEEGQRIVVKNGSEIQIIPTSEIYLLEANDDFVKIFTKDKSFLKKKTMNHYEEVMDPSRFFRPHRSYMFNLQYLNKIEVLEKNSYIGILTNGLKVPISRNSYSRLKEMLGI